MWNLKKWYKWIYKTETDSQTSSTSLWLLSGRVREGIVIEFEMSIYTLLYLKWITNKDLLQSTWSSAQCHVAAWMGGGFEGRLDTCVCVTESLWHSRETITALLTSYTPIQNKKSFWKGDIFKLVQIFIFIVNVINVLIHQLFPFIFDNCILFAKGYSSYSCFLFIVSELLGKIAVKRPCLNINCIYL